MAHQAFAMRTIALVGLDAETQLVVKSVLPGLRATTETVRLGPATVATLADLHPDLIVLEADTHPDLFSLIESLKTTPATSTVPIIVLTSQPDIARGRLSRQVFTVLPLPVEPDDLRVALHSALG